MAACPTSRARRRTSPALEVTRADQALSRASSRSTTCRSPCAPRRGPRAGRAERRRQVDADQYPVRHAPARRRHDPASTARRLRSRARATRSSLGIATVYQELSLLPNLTVAQNLALGREPRRLRPARSSPPCGATSDWRARASRPRHRTRDARVGDSVARRAADGRDRQGARRRDPSILILDEPTAPLGSARGASQLFAAIARLKAQGVAILYVSHRFAEVLDLCDRATVLRNGRHVDDDRTRRLDGGAAHRSHDRRQAPSATSASARGARRDRPRARRPALRRSACGMSSFAVRRGEILALTGLLGSGPERDRPAYRRRPSRRARACSRSDGRRSLCVGPQSAVAAGICLLTEDRKHEGILPNLPLRENIAIASLAARAASLGMVERPAERRSRGRRGCRRLRRGRRLARRRPSARSPAATSRRRCSHAGISPTPRSSS